MATGARALSQVCECVRCVGVREHTRLWASFEFDMTSEHCRVLHTHTNLCQAVVWSQSTKLEARGYVAVCSLTTDPAIGCVCARSPEYRQACANECEIPFLFVIHQTNYASVVFSHAVAPLLQYGNNGAVRLMPISGAAQSSGYC